jgi:hypothetical protein
LEKLNLLECEKYKLVVSTLDGLLRDGAQLFYLLVTHFNFVIFEFLWLGFNKIFMYVHSEANLCIAFYHNIMLSPRFLFSYLLLKLKTVAAQDITSKMQKCNFICGQA